VILLFQISNVYAHAEDKSNDTKDSFYMELEQEWVIIFTWKLNGAASK
jgi:plasmid maintenance system killer protein